ncbi:MAG TPA: hypothetical protein DCS42_13160 [Nitrospiraceae bacterium]|nr:hypothetical protein [Nitrospiraceae bacterium]
MRINKNSLAFRLLVPTFLLIGVVALVMLLLVHRISETISEDYHRFTITQYSNEVKHILDSAIIALTTANILDKPPVVEAKKRSVIEAISLYWRNNDLDGCIFDARGESLFSSLDEHLGRKVMALCEHQPGHFHFDEAGYHIHGHAIDFPAWEWGVVTLTRPITPVLYRRETAFLLPLIALGSALTAAGVFFIFWRNFRRPVRAIIAEIRSGGPVRPVGISELDTIGVAVNDSVDRLLKKTNQCQLLHNLAISIHENLSTDEVLRTILERAAGLIEAELAGIALYNDQGGFKKLITLGTPKEMEGRVPQGRGLLSAMRLSLVPLRIDDVAAHPGFSGAFPAEHPVVRNLLGYPIYDDGRPVGALYFGNKPGGFTAEDEELLKAISADAAIAVTRAEQVSELARFKQVIDSAFDVVIITDTTGRIRYVNPAFESITGYSREEAIGKNPNILKSGHHDEEFHKHVWDTINAGTMWKGEFINRKQDGSIYYASAIIFPISTEEGVNFVSIQRDVTHEKRLYEQLLRAQKMEAIGTLAGGIAHDFNNLLAAILGYSEIILTQTVEGDAFHKPASVIKHAAERGADLARKILMITRKEKMETRPLSLNKIISSAEELFQRSMPKNIEIVLNLKQDLPLIKADPTQIQQVVMNLAVNARDAMPDGGRLLIETTVVGTENGAANGLPHTISKSGFVKLSVSDTGMGMDVETQRKIFDPFFTTKETGKGTGLGLYIVHSVVSNHNGYINLYSEPRKGTRFAIYFPVTKDANQDAAEEPQDLRGSGTILVIDDESPIRELCRDMLEPLGYAVITAENGEEGIRAFREQKDSIALVILDMVMPKMGGSEVFQALMTIDPGVKVLICSGYTHDGFAGIGALMKNGAAGFIQKPFTRQTIGTTIKKVLSGHQPMV